MSTTEQPVERPASVGLIGWLVVAGLTFVLLVVGVTVAEGAYDVPLLVAFVAGSAQCAALPLALFRPNQATALQLAAVAVLALFIPPDSGATWPLTIPGLLTLYAFIALIALRTNWRVAVATWWATALVLVLLVLIDFRGRTVDDAAPTLVLYPTISGVLLLVTFGVRNWTSIRRQLAQARRDVAVEQSQRAVAEERTRIARELHDVVAHGMSVIHMQANSAAYRIKDLDPESKAEFTQIAAGARATMREMRRLLAVLRDESAEANLTPAPDLTMVGELVDSARRAGLPVELEADPELLGGAGISETTGLAAYRIVQESLSNVIRHAPGAPTRIAMVAEGGNLLFSVVNEPAGQPALPMEGPERAKHGLPGMRERVRLAGGVFEAGPRPEGGYRVWASLPIEGDE